MSDPVYRYTVYAPRSEDPLEATVMEPVAGAPHADPFVVASKAGLRVGTKLKFQDTFTDSENTDLHLHTADFPATEGWQSTGGNLMEIQGNEAVNIWQGSGQYAAQTDGTVGISFEVDDELYLDVEREETTDGYQQGFIVLGNGATNYVALFIENIDATHVGFGGVQFGQSAALDADDPLMPTIALAPGSKIRLGCRIVDGTHIEVWTEPAGGGKRTVHFLDATLNTDANGHWVLAVDWLSASDRTGLYTTAYGVPSNPSGNKDNLTVQATAEAKPYLAEVPTGIRGELDVLSASTSIGRLTLRNIDKRISDTDPQDNLERWFTAFTGSDTGYDRLRGCKIVVHESLDDGVTWTTFYTGRINGWKVDKHNEFILDVRDGADELKYKIFAGKPSSSATDVQMNRLWPLGLDSAYGTTATSPKATGEFNTGSGKTRTIDKITGTWNFVTKTLIGGADMSAGVNGFLLIRSLNQQALLRYTSGTVTDKAFRVRSIFGFKTGNKYGIGKLQIEELDSGHPDYVAFPTSGESCTLSIVHDGPPTEAKPIFINTIHPAQLLKDLLDGHYGLLDDSGDPQWTIPYDSTAMTALINDGSFPKCRFQIKEEAELGDWLDEYLLKPFGIALRFDPDGTLVPIDIRIPSNLSVPTIDTDDLVEGVVPRWEATGKAVTKVVSKWIAESRLVSVDEFRAIGDRVPDVPTSRFVEVENELITLNLTSSIDLGDKSTKINAAGYRSLTTEHGYGSTIGTWVARHLARRANDIMLQFSRGSARAIFSTRRVASVSGVNLLLPGDYRVVDIDTLPDPSTNKRGGPRLMQCISREEDGDQINFIMLDSGVNVTAAVPTFTSIGLTSGDAQYSVDCALLQNVSDDRIEVEYAVTETSVSTRPVEDSELWTHGGYQRTDGTLVIGGLQAGKRIWGRARSRPSGVDSGRQQPSAWVFPASPAGGYIDTSTITAPSALNESSITGKSAVLAWTNGDANLATELFVVQDGGTLSDNYIAILPAGSSKARIENLSLSTTYDWGVRHVEPSGGVSAIIEDTFITTAFANQATSMEGPPQILLGADPDGGGIPDVPEDQETFWMTVGVYIRILVGNNSLQSELQRKEMPSGSWETIDTLNPGVNAYVDPLYNDGKSYRYRARHVGGGFDDGAWSGESDTCYPNLLPDGLIEPGTEGGGVTLPTQGGTGISTYTIGDLIVSDGTASLTVLNAVAVGNVMLSQGVATAPAYGKVADAHVDAAAAIGWTKISKTGSSLADLATRSASDLNSGILAATQGGTGKSSHTSTSIIYFDGTDFESAGAASTGALLYSIDGSGWNVLAAGTSGWYLKMQGAVPMWSAFSAGALDDLSDVTITTPSTGQYIRKSVGDWVNTALDVTDTSAGPDDTFLVARTGTVQWDALDQDDIPILSATWVGSVAWTKVSKTGSSLADLATRAISDTTGTLAATRGGTGKAAWTQGGVVYANTTTTLDDTGTGAQGSIIWQSGAGTWQPATPATTGEYYLKVDNYLVSWDTITPSAPAGGWNVADGGTGLQSLSSGALLVGAGTADVTFLAPSPQTVIRATAAGTAWETVAAASTGQFLKMTANTPNDTATWATLVKADVSDTPWAWTDVSKTGSNLTDLATRIITDTTGTLTVARGGTGKTSWTVDTLVYASAATTLASIDHPGSTGDRYLIWNDTLNVYQWTALPAGTIGGSGTTNTIAKFSASTTLANSQITDTGSTVTIGTDDVDIGDGSNPTQITLVEGLVGTAGIFGYTRGGEVTYRGYSRDDAQTYTIAAQNFVSYIGYGYSSAGTPGWKAGGGLYFTAATSWVTATSNEDAYMRIYLRFDGTWAERWRIHSDGQWLSIQGYGLGSTTYGLGSIYMTTGSGLYDDGGQALLTFQSTYVTVAAGALFLDGPYESAPPAGIVGITESGGGLWLGARASIYAQVDNDNNNTGQGFFVQNNGATVIYAFREDYWDTYDKYHNGNMFVRNGLYVGTSDSVTGVIGLYGSAVSEGGELRIYTAADSDAVVDYFYIDAYSDRLRFVSQADVFMYYDDGDDYLYNDCNWRNTGLTYAYRNSDEQIRVATQSATGNPFISFYQTTTQRGYLQFVNGGTMRLASVQGNIQFYASNALTATLTASQFYPATNADDLGTSSLRWDAYLQTVTHYGRSRTVPYNAGNTGTSLAINFANGDIQYCTVNSTGSVTITFTGGLDGQTLILYIHYSSVPSALSLSADWGDHGQPTWKRSTTHKDRVVITYYDSSYMAVGAPGFSDPT